uniref:Uncharacterized protein n=1 Tax=Lotharella globosa TaxID=91324 RepID=A0A7S3ZE11_9EUKA
MMGQRLYSSASPEGPGEQALGQNNENHANKAKIAKEKIHGGAQKRRMRIGTDDDDDGGTPIMLDWVSKSQQRLIDKFLFNRRRGSKSGGNKRNRQDANDGRMLELDSSFFGDTSDAVSR